jgi:carboxypeptidase C (cathepsin A)
MGELSSVIQSGITVLLWAGDADWICNWIGGLGCANAASWSGQSTFSKMAMSSYTVNGVAGGLYKTLNNLSWLTVFGAGHEVPYYSE